MPRTRKAYWWDVDIRGNKTRVRSKTFGGAVHKARKRLHISTREYTAKGGFEGVSCVISNQQ